MKKLIALALCTVMVLCASCAKAEAPVETAAVKEETTAAPTTAAPETKAPETEAPKEEEKPAAEEPKYIENPALLHPSITINHEGAQTQGNRMAFTVTYPNVNLPEDEAKKYPELATALLEDLNNNFDMFALDAKQRIVENFDDSMLQDENFDGYYYKTNAAVTRCDENFFSVKSTNDAWFGGAHPDYAVQGTTYKTIEGTLVTPADIFKDKESLLTVLKEKLTAIPDVEYFNLEEDLKQYEFESSYMANKIAFNMILTSDAVVFYFNPYELAPYASGMQIVTLPYSAYADIMRPGVANASANYVYPVDMNAEVVSQNGTFTVSGQYNEYGICKNIVLTVDGTQESFETFSYAQRPYLVQKDGKTSVVIFQDADDDEVFYQTFTISGGKASLEGKKEYKDKSKFEQLSGTPMRDDWSFYANKTTRACFCDPDQ